MILLSSAPSAMSLLAVSLAQVVFIPAINQTLSASFFWPRPVIPVRKAVLVSVPMSDVGISKHERDGGGSPDELPSPRAPLLSCAKLQTRAPTPFSTGFLWFCPTLAGGAAHAASLSQSSMRRQVSTRTALSVPTRPVQTEGHLVTV